MNISSTFWIIIIALGALIVAIGNIYYNKSSERERQRAASVKALSMLDVESKNNLKHISSMRPILVNGQVPTETFETTAWAIVLNGGLLVQVDKDTLGDIADAYYLIGVADKYHTNLIELSSGVAMALQASGELRQQYTRLLIDTLDKLEPKLQAVLAKENAP